MDYREFTVMLPADQIDRLHARAAEREVTPGDIVGELVRKAFGAAAETPFPRAEPPQIARLRARLAPTMAGASSWGSLQVRLAHHGYELRPTGGGGLALHDAQGTRLCNAADLGFGQCELARKFGVSLPGRLARQGDLFDGTDAGEGPHDPSVRNDPE